MFELNQKTALVTGAGQNVGAGIARTLASQGAHVLVNDIVTDRASEVADQIAASGCSAEALPFDVTDGDDVRAAI
ncbi:MAG: SDR family NAD(P)-dependent oxidoreductase, partial [Acidimicrobiia bacterium]|nr:SDR family NAD(P)-dependent oxidoreductase [Acidimicrobiia bacterium]